MPYHTSITSNTAGMFGKQWSKVGMLHPISSHLLCQAYHSMPYIFAMVCENSFMSDSPEDTLSKESSSTTTAETNSAAISTPSTVFLMFAGKPSWTVVTRSRMSLRILVASFIYICDLLISVKVFDIISSDINNFGISEGPSNLYAILMASANPSWTSNI